MKALIPRLFLIPKIKTFERFLKNCNIHSNTELILSSSNSIYEPGIVGYFCLDVVLNLSRILPEPEIKYLGKGLNFAPIHNKINKPQLPTSFHEFGLK